jgi:small subunit ribosomal protein S17e
MAQELVKRYPDEFTEDFENNKKIVQSLIAGVNKKTRNQIAGYITGLLGTHDVSKSVETS